MALGLVKRNGWTRVGGPLLAAGSAGVSWGVVGITPPASAVALCGLVALGGVVARRRYWG